MQRVSQFKNKRKHTFGICRAFTEHLNYNSLDKNHVYTAESNHQVNTTSLMYQTSNKINNRVIIKTQNIAFPVLHLSEHDTDTTTKPTCELILTKSKTAILNLKMSTVRVSLITVNKCYCILNNNTS